MPYAHVAAAPVQAAGAPELTATSDLSSSHTKKHKAKKKPAKKEEYLRAVPSGAPAGAKQLTRELPTAIRGLRAGKVTARKALMHPKLPDQKQVQKIFHEIESHDERIELNLYIVGELGEDEETV